MENENKYKEIFQDVFNINEASLNTQFTIELIKDWDSIRHLSLIAELEDAFDMMLDTDDILDFSSYEKGKEILNKHGIKI